MPLERFAHAVSQLLERRGFVPLDARRGAIGGNRHGAWEWIWMATSASSESFSYALVLADETRPEQLDVSVWAVAERPPRLGRALVGHARAVPTEPEDFERSGWSDRLFALILAAADQAGQLSDADLMESYPSLREPAEGMSTDLGPMEREQDIELQPRDPPEHVKLEIEGLIEIEPEREWRNADVLRELRRRRVVTDRAAVNAALAALADQGLIQRVSRGRYRSGRE